MEWTPIQSYENCEEIALCIALYHSNFDVDIYRHPINNHSSKSASLGTMSTPCLSIYMYTARSTLWGLLTQILAQFLSDKVVYARAYERMQQKIARIDLTLIHMHFFGKATRCTHLILHLNCCLIKEKN